MARLEQTIEIDAPEQTVWEILSDFGTAARWAPLLSHSRLEGSRRKGVGAVRVLRHVWGFTFIETVTTWHDSNGFSYDIRGLPFPMSDGRERWSMSAVNNGTTTVTTRVDYGMRLAWIGAWFDRLLLARVVRKNMRDGLGGLKRAAEAERGAGRPYCT